jgi:PAS domain S-box-containing protein
MLNDSKQSKNKNKNQNERFMLRFRIANLCSPSINLWNMKKKLWCRKKKNKKNKIDSKMSLSQSNALLLSSEREEHASKRFVSGGLSFGSEAAAQGMVEESRLELQAYEKRKKESDLAHGQRKSPGAAKQIRGHLCRKSGVLDRWQHKYFILEVGERMLYEFGAASDAHKKGKKGAKRQWALDKCKTMYDFANDAVRPHAFYLLSVKKGNVLANFQAANDAERVAWVDVMQACGYGTEPSTLELERINGAALCSNDVGVIVALNNAALELLGYEIREQLVGRNVRAVVSSSHCDAHQGYVQRYSLGGGGGAKASRFMDSPDPRVLSAVRRDGTPVAVLLRLSEIMEGVHRRFLATMNPYVADSDVDVDTAVQEFRASAAADVVARETAASSSSSSSNTRDPLQFLFGGGGGGGNNAESSDDVLGGRVPPPPDAVLMRVLIDLGDLKGVTNLIADNRTYLHVRDEHGWTPLHQACDRASVPMVELLIRLGADPTLLSHSGAMPFDYFVRSKFVDGDGDGEKGSTLAEAKRLLTMLAATGQWQVNHKNERGDTPLLRSVCGHGKGQLVPFLIERGADVNLGNEQSNTPLLLATFENLPHVVKALIDAGADAKVANRRGQTPLQVATDAQLDDIVALLSQYFRAKRNGQCDFLITELVDTERSYCDDLRVLADVFRAGLAKLRVSDKALRAIFGNVDALRAGNNRLLAELEAALADDVEQRRVGRVLLGYLDHFRLYVAWCENQPISMASLELIEQHPSIAAYLDSVHSRAECHGLTLRSFLIKPLQRLCRYPLMIRQLLKFTSDDIVDHRDRLLAFERIGDIVAEANETKRTGDLVLSTVQTLEKQGVRFNSHQYLVEHGPLTWRVRSASNANDSSSSSSSSSGASLSGRLRRQSKSTAAVAIAADGDGAAAKGNDDDELDAIDELDDVLGKFEGLEAATNMNESDSDDELMIADGSTSSSSSSSIESRASAEAPTEAKRIDYFFLFCDMLVFARALTDASDRSRVVGYEPRSVVYLNGACLFWDIPNYEGGLAFLENCIAVVRTFSLGQPKRTLIYASSPERKAYLIDLFRTQVQRCATQRDEIESAVRYPIARHELFDERAVDPSSTVLPIHEAALRNDVVAVRELCASGAELLNMRDSQNRTPLACAASALALDACRLLVKQQGVAVNLPTVLGLTPLMILVQRAAEHSEATMLRAARRVIGNMMLNSCRVNVINWRDGATALHYAAKSASPSAIGYLLSNGADPNVCDNAGLAPLTMLVAQRQYALARQLIQFGADPTLVGAGGGLSALDVARQAGPRAQRLVAAMESSVEQRRLEAARLADSRAPPVASSLEELMLAHQLPRWLNPMRRDIEPAALQLTYEHLRSNYHHLLSIAQLLQSQAAERATEIGQLRAELDDLRAAAEPQPSAGERSPPVVAFADDDKASRSKRSKRSRKKSKRRRSSAHSQQAVAQARQDEHEENEKAEASYQDMPAPATTNEGADFVPTRQASLGSSKRSARAMMRAIRNSSTMLMAADQAADDRPFGAATARSSDDDDNSLLSSASESDDNDAADALEPPKMIAPLPPPLMPPSPPSEIRGPPPPPPSRSPDLPAAVVQAPSATVAVAAAAQDQAALLPPPPPPANHAAELRRVGERALHAIGVLFRSLAAFTSDRVASEADMQQIQEFWNVSSMLMVPIVDAAQYDIGDVSLPEPPEASESDPLSSTRIAIARHLIVAIQAVALLEKEMQQTNDVAVLTRTVYRVRSIASHLSSIHVDLRIQSSQYLKNKQLN